MVVARASTIAVLNAMIRLLQSDHRGNRAVLSSFAHKFLRGTSATSSGVPEQWYYFSHYFCRTKIHMGLEQLALIKEQLAKKAQADRAARPIPIKRAPTKAPAPKKESRQVDPVLLAIGELQKRFPQAFPKKPAAKVPLKLGIHKDVLAQAEAMGVAPKVLQEALKTWVWGSRYWACLVENALRVDLSGAHAGQVTQPEAERARRFEGKRGKPSNPAPIAVVAPQP